MIIVNLANPSQVLTARYLLMNVLNTIKVLYDHSYCVRPVLCVGK